MNWYDWLLATRRSRNLAPLAPAVVRPGNAIAVVGMLGRAAVAFERALQAVDGNDAAALRRRAVLMEAIATVAVLVVLVLMIFKPGV